MKGIVTKDGGIVDAFRFESNPICKASPGTMCNDSPHILQQMDSLSRYCRQTQIDGCSFSISSRHITHTTQTFTHVQQTWAVVKIAHIEILLVQSVPTQHGYILLLPTSASCYLDSIIIGFCCCHWLRVFRILHSKPMVTSCVIRSSDSLPDLNLWRWLCTQLPRDGFS